VLRMWKKRGEDKERVKNSEERKGGQKGLRMLKKRGEDKERVENLEEMKGRKKKELRMLKKIKQRKG
jgi:hypothetical protein